MDTPDLEEGSPCPTGCGGTLAVPATENCSCHVSAPCSACGGAKLRCSTCHWEEGDDINFNAAGGGQ